MHELNSTIESIIRAAKQPKVQYFHPIQAPTTAYANAEPANQPVTISQPTDHQCNTNDITATLPSTNNTAKNPSAPDQTLRSTSPRNKSDDRKQRPTNPILDLHDPIAGPNGVETHRHYNQIEGNRMGKTARRKKRSIPALIARKGEKPLPLPHLCFPTFRIPRVGDDGPKSKSTKFSDDGCAPHICLT